MALSATLLAAAGGLVARIDAG
ncbi:MAG: hypothetical protein QOF44_3602, partial [Streptomyces sp.]|nr:hypothetical protein [Streptomyces sp.]